MENLNVNQEMNFDEMADVVGGQASGGNGDTLSLNFTQCMDLGSQYVSLMTTYEAIKGSNPSLAGQVKELADTVWLNVRGFC